MTTTTDYRDNSYNGRERATCAEPAVRSSSSVRSSEPLLMYSRADTGAVSARVQHDVNRKRVGVCGSSVVVTRTTRGWRQTPHTGERARIDQTGFRTRPKNAPPQLPASSQPLAAVIAIAASRTVSHTSSRASRPPPTLRVRAPMHQNSTKIRGVQPPSIQIGQSVLCCSCKVLEAPPPLRHAPHTPASPAQHVHRELSTYALVASMRDVRFS